MPSQQTTQPLLTPTPPQAAQQKSMGVDDKSVSIDEYVVYAERELVYLEGFADAMPEDVCKRLRGRVSGMRKNLKSVKRWIEDHRTKCPQCTTRDVVSGLCSTCGHDQTLEDE